MKYSMKRNNASRKLPLLKLGTEDYSFGPNDEKTLVLSPRSTFFALQADQFSGSPLVWEQQSVVKRNGKLVGRKQGWTEVSQGAQIPQLSPGTFRRILPAESHSSKKKNKEIKYNLRMSPRSADSAAKNETGKTLGKENSSSAKSGQDERVQYLSPIEIEASKRHERRVKQREERKQSKDSAYFL